MPLGDASLRALEALGSEASAKQIREHLSSEFGMQVRPNHLGMALQRHRPAGRLEPARRALVDRAGGIGGTGAEV